MKKNGHLIDMCAFFTHGNQQTTQGIHLKLVVERLTRFQQGTEIEDPLIEDGIGLTKPRQLKISLKGLLGHRMLLGLSPL